MIRRQDVVDIVAGCDGILPLSPAWVARNWISSGRRLGLSEAEYEVGARGEICERWLASATEAANEVSEPHEGLSQVTVGPEPVLLADLMKAAPEVVMGAEYATGHDGLGRLAKIFDYGERVPMHVHPPSQAAAQVGLTSKDEAYYFLPGAGLGPHPESFFGAHADLSAEEASAELLRHLELWQEETVLGLSKAYRQFSEGGYYVPSGVIHAPGTALTFELQEDSDAMAFLQAQCGEIALDRDLLLGRLDQKRVAEEGDRAVLDWIDWDLNLVADFHSSHHLQPRAISTGDGVEVAWILFGSGLFSAKRYRATPGSTFVLDEPGPFSVFVWTGDADLGGRKLRGGAPGSDEALVTCDRAGRGVEVEVRGSDELEMIVYFGPDLQPAAPVL